jgi:hypothetical protein
MHKVFLLVIAAAFSMAVHADDADRAGQPLPTYEDFTDDTGVNVIIAMPVTECTQPTATPPAASEQFLVESNFTYYSCRQVKTARYAVTGDAWNQNRSEVQGTAKISYQLRRTFSGGSDFIDAGTDANNKPNVVSQERYTGVVTKVTKQCDDLRAVVMASQKSLESTPCAGQTPSL